MYSIASTASYFMTRKVQSKARPQIRRNKSIILDPNGKEVRINVSGFQFRIHESYLKQYPKTLLGSSRKEIYFDEKNNEYFFDRDPHIFRFILKFYRTGKLHYSTAECCEAYADEFTFFRIKHDGMASSCCGDNYNAYCEKLSELAKESEESNDKTMTFREKCWKFCDDPTFSFLSKVFYYLSCLVITLSIVMNTIETVSCEAYRNNTMVAEQCGDAYPDLFFKVDTICVTFFTLEYLIRFYGAAERWKYVKSIMSIIDILAILPFFVDLLMLHLNVLQNSNISNILVALRSVRIMRVFKLARHSNRLRELSTTIARSTSELGFILFMYLNVVIIFATCIYYAENSDGGKSEFVSIPEAMWYTVVTTTTLGYGDIVPQTIQGKLIGSLCCLMGVLVIALPVPIIQMKSAGE